MREATSFRGGIELPAAASGDPPEHTLELVVPYFDPSLAASALSKALELARGLDARVTLMAVLRRSDAVSSGVMARKVDSTKNGVSRKKNLTMTEKKKSE